MGWWLPSNGYLSRLFHGRCLATSLHDTLFLNEEQLFGCDTLSHRTKKVVLGHGSRQRSKIQLQSPFGREVAAGIFFAIKFSLFFTLKCKQNISVGFKKAERGN
jgi:hypothetical protein